MSEISDELQQTIEEARKRRRKIKDVDPGDSVFRGDRLREVRREYGLNQDDVANLLGITRTQVVNLETGRSNTSINALYMIAYHFGVSADWLLGLSDVRTRCDTPPPGVGVGAQDDE